LDEVRVEFVVCFVTEVIVEGVLGVAFAGLEVVWMCGGVRPAPVDSSILTVLI
jgi:hypothetical protein